MPQILLYETVSWFSASTSDQRQYKTFPHTQTIQGAHDPQKQTGFVRYQNPFSSLHSRKNVCADSKTELSSQQSNCQEKHMNLNLFTLFCSPHTYANSFKQVIHYSLGSLPEQFWPLCRVNSTVRKSVTFERSWHTLETVNSHFFLSQWLSSHVPAKNLFFSFHVFCSSFLN